MGAVELPDFMPQVQDAPSARDLIPSRPINQVKGFSCTTTLRNGYVVPVPAVTPVTELGKVQLTATAPPGVLEPHPAAEVVAE